MKAPHQMTLEELGQELEERGYNLRGRLVVDEFFPNSTHIVTGHGGRKWECDSRLDVAILVLKLRQGSL